MSLEDISGQESANHIPMEYVEIFLMSDNISEKVTQDVIRWTYADPKIHDQFLRAIGGFEEKTEQARLTEMYKFWRKVHKPIALIVSEQEERFQAYLATLSPEEREKAIREMVKKECSDLLGENWHESEE